jgi:nucleoside 2-deoxyribosyltransferase
MAFDQDDTDLWFDTLLAPTLRLRGWQPRRIDRIEHNDNIDARIIDELTRAEIVIADLTYARPSVYFEAGFAQRVTPVIYTCRADHLRAGAPEALRVHFDLAMKNIIRWSSHQDPSFARRLNRRIDIVARPLLAQRARDQVGRQEELEFDSLAPSTKLARLQSLAQEVVRENGYSIAEYAPSRAMERGLYDGNLVVGRTTRQNVLKATQMRVSDSFTQASITKLRDFLAHPLFDISVARPGQLQSVRDSLVLISPGRLPLSRLRASLQEFALVDEGSKHLEFSGMFNIPGKRMTATDYVLRERSHRRIPEFVGYRDLRQAFTILPESEKKGSTRRQNTIFVPIRLVPRTIHVIAVDGIKSEGDGKRRIQQALQSI